MIKEFLEIGEIVGTHGLRGELRVNPWCDTPEFFSQFQTLYFQNDAFAAVEVHAVRPHGNVVLLLLAGVDTVEKAQALRGKVLFIRRADARIAPGAYFIAELSGCAVWDADDPQLCYGTLTQVSETGANDVWHILRDGKEYLLPAIKEVVVAVDVENDHILIRPLKGIFEDTDKTQ